MDLWPNDISQTNITSFPGQVLKEQARLLGEKTKNLVTAEVFQDEVEKDDHFKFSFSIFSPVTGGYRFWVFSISHGIHFYPVTFHMDSDVANEVHDGDGYTDLITIDEEAEFLNFLKAILSSKKVRRVVSSLLAMSQVGEKPRPSAKKKRTESPDSDVPF
jgi:hypothetical protein